MVGAAETPAPESLPKVAVASPGGATPPIHEVSMSGLAVLTLPRVQLWASGLAEAVQGSPPVPKPCYASLCQGVATST